MLPRPLLHALAVCAAVFTLPAQSSPDAFLGQQAPDLPPFERVLTALSELPVVRAARQGQSAQEAVREALVAGSQEWQVRSSLTRRNVSGLGVADQAGHFNEWELAVERPWRSAGKARIDRQIGDAAVSYAENAVGDAVHEAARELLRRWFELRRNEAQADVLRTQRALWGQTRAAVARRVEAGDAARLELDLIEANLADADARLADAAGRAQRARDDFDRAYPALAGAVPPGQCLPRQDDFSLDDYLGRVQAEHHEIAMAQAEFDRRLQVAERMRADEHPDPTFGLRVASERGGAEHLAGVVLTLPLGGDSRSAATRAALAEAEVAREHLAQVQRRVQGEVAYLVATQQGQFRTWQASQTSAERFAAVASRGERAYSLGETGLSEVLASRRQEQEARLAEVATRNDACEVFYRLRLDTHALWPMDAADHP